MNDKILVESTKRITQKYKNSHLGVDIGYRVNEEQNIIKAHSQGKIIEIIDGKDRNLSAKGLESYGNYILIDHGNDFKTRYAHLKKNSIAVTLNEIVNENTTLAIIGNSGKSIGRHLHFEVYKKNKRIDPTFYLNHEFLEKKITYQSYDIVKKKWLPNVFTNTNDYAGNLGNSISGIYIDQLKYRVHDKVKGYWLPYVYGRDDYAGNLENPIDGIQIQNAIYQVHLKNGEWLDWVTKIDDSNQGYAGIYGKEIDAIRIKQ